MKFLEIKADGGACRSPLGLNRAVNYSLHRLRQIQQKQNKVLQKQKYKVPVRTKNRASIIYKKNSRCFRCGLLEIFAAFFFGLMLDAVEELIIDTALFPSIPRETRWLPASSGRMLSLQQTTSQHCSK